MRLTIQCLISLAVLHGDWISRVLLKEHDVYFLGLNERQSIRSPGEFCPYIG